MFGDVARWIMSATARPAHHGARLRTNAASLRAAPRLRQQGPALQPKPRPVVSRPLSPLRALPSPGSMFSRVLGGMGGNQKGGVAARGASVTFADTAPSWQVSRPD